MEKARENARRAAVMIGKPTCGMVSSSATERGDLCAAARSPHRLTDARFCSIWRLVKSAVWAAALSPVGQGGDCAQADACFLPACRAVPPTIQELRLGSARGDYVLHRLQPRRDNDRGPGRPLIPAPGQPREARRWAKE